MHDGIARDLALVQHVDYVKDPGVVDDERYRLLDHLCSPTQRHDLSSFEVTD